MPAVDAIMEPPQKRRVIGLFENYTEEVQTRVVEVPSTPERKTLTPKRDEENTTTEGDIFASCEDAVDMDVGECDVLASPCTPKRPSSAPTPAPTPSNEALLLSPGFRHGWHAHNFEAPQPRAIFSPPRPVPSAHATGYDLAVEQVAPLVSGTPKKAYHTDFFAPLTVVEELEKERQIKQQQLEAPRFARRAFCARDFEKSIVPAQRRVRTASEMLGDDNAAPKKEETVVRSFGRRAFHLKFYSDEHKKTEAPQPLEAPRTGHYMNNFELGSPIRTNNGPPASPLRPAAHKKLYDGQANEVETKVA